MSDNKAQQEPSMEDILASIRRILSEDDAEEASKVTAPPSIPEPETPPPPAPPQDEEEDVLELTDAMVVDDPPAPGPEPVSEPSLEPEPELDSFPEEEPFLPPEDEPRPDFHVHDHAPPAFVPPPAAAIPAPPLPREAESLLAPPTVEASATAIAELSRVMVRDKNLGLGDGGATIEVLVRELLQPLLKEWLDNNLPQIVERIVKKEIEKMVERAEKL